MSVKTIEWQETGFLFLETNAPSGEGKTGKIKAEKQKKKKKKSKKKKQLLFHKRALERVTCLLWAQEDATYR